MALPKLNESIRYELEIPSSKKKITFRPYFVKEEKILLQAFESKDEKLSMRAMIDTIVACVYDTVNPKTLTTYDVEYMFTQIRARSVGETSNFNAKCQQEDCEASTEVVVDLTSVEIVQDNPKSPTIELNEEISIELRYPTYLAFINNYKEGMTGSEFGMIMVKDCIVSINTPDERITEWSLDEITGFIDSMTTQQFEKVTEFIDSTPSLQKKIEWTCSACNRENKLTLEGLSDFF